MPTISRTPHSGVGGGQRHRARRGHWHADRAGPPRRGDARSPARGRSPPSKTPGGSWPLGLWREVNLWRLPARPRMLWNSQAILSNAFSVQSPNLTLVFGPGPGRLRRAAIRRFMFKANPAMSALMLETPLTCQPSPGRRTPVSVGVNGIAPGAAVACHRAGTCRCGRARSSARGPRCRARGSVRGPLSTPSERIMTNDSNLFGRGPVRPDFFHV